MGAQSLAVACGALALCLALTTATNPGFVVRITQAGLDYAHQQGITVLEKELTHLKLPDVSGDFRVLRVGKVHYDLSRLRLRDFHLPYSRISPVANVGLQVSISNAFTDLDGNWRVKFHFIRDHGSFDLKVENIYIKISLRLGSDATGKPTISSSGCSTRISKVRAHFSGRFGWLYNLFYSAVEHNFKKILESKVCDTIAQSVRNDLQKYVQTLPVTAKIDAKTGIDYSLVASPTATAQSLDADLKGEFYSLAHRSTVPFPTLPLAFPPDHDRMVYFGASSYFFNTAGFAYHAAGALVFEITDAMIPKDVDFHLNTSIFSAFVPELEQMYPNMPMKIRLSAPSAPFLNIGPGGISLKPVVDVQAYAILPNSSLAPLFLLSLTGNVSAVIDVRSGHIVGRLDVGRIRLSLKHSDVGTFQVRMLQSIMNIFASKILLPRLNAIQARAGLAAGGAQGGVMAQHAAPSPSVKIGRNFLCLPPDHWRRGKGWGEEVDAFSEWPVGSPLPLPDRIRLSNTLVRFHQNFLLLGADVQFQPQGRR
ncbi:PREDICTED: bactericidal permeability-increasing protein-like [Acanthisitta chloris]|uniref:bactericidal permeability-increasing protein-like n=1 Tax=Acanthisitta chloris TaxID=57068 RepID=UPI0004F0E157|nr:PREDICTED: bactericidal permeability-increasing protein-like [Acanthisitta chloris]